MSILSILSTLFIGPLKLIFEIIFGVANRFVSNPGLAIIFLSLAMNILVLPLYKRADAMQEAARDTEAKLKAGVDHIKKTFSGDERMMMLQAYYRQNNYKPTSSLNGSVSLLLEIPFFMAAYQFLSHLDILNGVSFGPIADLGAPDGLIVIGGFAINLLPVLMTFINVISSAIYLKGFPLKTKIQLYGIALFFLVFLWTSPAGLVFYWTLNNIFSLVKNIFYKIKNPQKVLRILTFTIGIAAVVFGAAFYDASVLKKLFIVTLGAALMLPLVLNLLKSRIRISAKKTESKPNTGMFILGSVFMTVLVGVLIPSAYISASTLEYIDITYFHNPMWYIASTAAMSAGFFLVWFGVFYWLANPAGKIIFTRLMWILSGVAITNYMFFGTKLGTISAQLQYETGLSFSSREHLINVLVLIVVAAVLLFISIKWTKVCTTVLLTAAVAVFGMAALNMSSIHSSASTFASSENLKLKGFPNFDLSTEGENVVVIMLDRAMGEYVPYIFAEKPELVEKFAGFTYYKNTISFAPKTNMAVPALLGGYEYTPVEINKRDTESLVSKHNEALKVMPVLFSNNGFDVTVCDPTYANYSWIPDLSIFDEYPDINAYITKGVFGNTTQKQSAIDSNHRNFFCFAVMKSMPTLLQRFIYDNGTYNRLQTSSAVVEYAGQERTDLSHATGLDSIFMNPYNVLTNMSQMTTISEEDKNTFLFLSNDTTHDPILLQTPDYIPSVVVDNEEYDAAHTDRFTVDGVTLKVETEYQMLHYHANMAALLRLGEWFDFLRENDVYDNTKIILVADHGSQNINHLDGFWLDEYEDEITNINDLRNTEAYYPLLMVKEIGSREFTTSNEFMTNADVPTLATNGLIEDPVNPFTGKPINSDEKTAHDQFICISRSFDVTSHKGNSFNDSYWASVKDDIYDPENWVLHRTWTVLKEHVAPKAK